MAPVAIAATWAGSPWFDVLVLVAAAALSWEWARVCGYGRFGGLQDWLFVGAAVGIVLLGATGVSATLLLAATGLVTLAWYVAMRAGGTEAPGWRALGLLLVTLACVCLLSMRRAGDEGLHAIIWIFLVTWSVDTGGYVVGRLVGGPRLAPRISPKKTWSGMIGGLLAAIAVGAAYAYGVATMAFFAAATAALVVGSAAVAGDLVESAAKRRFRLKDSSMLIPGHGGLLDRVDGLLLAAPVAGVVLAESWRWG